MKKVTFNSVQYTSKFINANFRIKAHGLNALGEKINTLVGVSGAIALIGAELLVKFISGAENGTGYYEYFDDSELDESGEPTQEQIDELKNFLSDNYNYIPE